MVQCVVNRYTIKVRMIDKRVDIDLIVFYIYTCKCLLCISINYNTKMSKCCDMNDGRSNLWKKICIFALRSRQFRGHTHLRCYTYVGTNYVYYWSYRAPRSWEILIFVAACHQKYAKRYYDAKKLVCTYRAGGDQ